MPTSLWSSKPRSDKNLAPVAPIGARTQKSKLPGEAKFRIVGIGASAGGPQALTTFLDHTPADSGKAFIVVQHLDPSHPGMMPEQPHRHTAMPVAEARKRTKVKLDNVNVIARNRDRSILHGALCLLEPMEKRELRLPIDFFPRSRATSKDEMRSLNEELQTVNAELQAKAVEMSCVTSDMENRLNSTETSTVFLDPELNIRRFTPYAKSLLKLLPVDSGRSLSHIVSDLEYSDLLADASEVLRTLIRSERTVRAHNGRYFDVCITSYRNVASLIDGVVMSFTDISDAHAMNAALEQGLKIVREGLQGRGGKAERAALLEGMLRKLQQLLHAHVTSPAATAAKHTPDLLPPP